MGDVLEVNHRPLDPQRPLVCLDEFCKQLLGEKRLPQAARPGRPARYDYEYRREGCATAFMTHAPVEGRREIFITDTARRTQIDYAHTLEFIASELFPDAEKIILVEDNLNTHKDASLYLAFGPEKARSLARRFERHYTPKHSSRVGSLERIELIVRINPSAVGVSGLPTASDEYPLRPASTSRLIGHVLPPSKLAHTVTLP